jgi:hypothetical protein
VHEDGPGALVGLKLHASSFQSNYGDGMEVVPRRYFQKPIILAAFSESRCRDLDSAGKGNIVSEKKAAA